jgi:hypothetical protein
LIRIIILTILLLSALLSSTPLIDQQVTLRLSSLKQSDGGGGQHKQDRDIQLSRDMDRKEGQYVVTFEEEGALQRGQRQRQGE